MDEATSYKAFRHATKQVFLRTFTLHEVAWLRRVTRIISSPSRASQTENLPTTNVATRGKHSEQKTLYISKEIQLFLSIRENVNPRKYPPASDKTLFILASCNTRKWVTKRGGGEVSYLHTYFSFFFFFFLFSFSRYLCEKQMTR